ncbi:MAG: PIN domain-containing protein [Planctomycetes bacterium]|nr:PIN domain-containing protein [Planctomycetota bacterium]
MTYLLDINVLIALFDSAHVHHEAAHRWFAAAGASSWATCPITENGFVRVVCNPAYPTVSASPGEAVQRLQVFCREPGHVFWSDDASLNDKSLFDVGQLSGHQQITDLYLAGLAAHHGGMLATFDTRIPTAALQIARTDVVEIVPPS